MLAAARSPAASVPGSEAHPGGQTESRQRTDPKPRGQGRIEHLKNLDPCNSGTCGSLPSRAGFPTVDPEKC